MIKIIKRVEKMVGCVSWLRTQTNVYKDLLACTCMIHSQATSDAALRYLLTLVPLFGSFLHQPKSQMTKSQNDLPQNAIFLHVNSDSSGKIPPTLVNIVSSFECFQYNNQNYFIVPYVI